MQRRRDLRDSGHPGIKQWEELRAGLASALLQAWLLDELDKVAPHYFASLQYRFEAGFDNAAALQREDASYDGDIPVAEADGEGTTWWDARNAEEMYDMLFPHGDAEGDARFMAWGAVPVILYSALESFARASGVMGKGGVVQAIRQHLRTSTGADLDAQTADILADFEATRHVFAHNRGIIDESYVRHVPGCGRVIGERRSLEWSAISRFCRAIRTAAERLRATHPTEG